MRNQKMSVCLYRMMNPVETTHPKRGRGRPQKSVNDFQATQSKKRAASNNNQIDADHVHESCNKRRKK
ncbi:hypothetical protein BpHYR1_047371 [Brachionus plicatilis]|uniref:Uncharacterized protein n=1 Tax=Brachionus plicatilis TaxID=10195 RepID=A0A3M7PHS0_BRAPC|nr:hypothetical protein BpHYR1_047371 [Brachionus plicatilis]